MSRKEINAKKESIIITAVVGILCALLLFLSFEFKKESDKKPLMIELAMLEDTNYGNTDLGQGPEEPAPAAESHAPTPEPAPAKSEPTPAPAPKPTKSVTTPQKTAPVKSKTQTTTKKLPVASNKTSKTESKSSSTQGKTSNKNSSAQPQGDSQGKSALENILGGKGKNKSTGQGNSGSAGNYGDPKGTTDHGKNIGENWKTRVPENQSHNCDSSGSVIVDIVVNANGSIKRATPRPAKSQCLADTAKKLVLKYVTAYPGEDGRRGTYRVNLK
ncbi:hypothetical protein EDM00_04600 [Ornithobacterium rhinotracheale]|uniref:hypothetical protein n=1 Tax=Ornithobacterium rhinotracheale TaxID=28251 RepID=UPI00129C5910|nr:hypothetical protein [Ornithobacterium rhinotracheale]MRI63275.1 hypothetical protein [Ornithobacterium rhinotracheale]MRJ09979.1 hypothetical protein [Ornithobacterium rhinotracheale]